MNVCFPLVLFLFPVSASQPCVAATPPPALPSWVCVQEASQGPGAVACCPGNAQGLLASQILAVPETSLLYISSSSQSFFSVFSSFFRIMIVVLKTTSIKAKWFLCIIWIKYDIFPKGMLIYAPFWKLSNSCGDNFRSIRSWMVPVMFHQWFLRW